MKNAWSKIYTDRLGNQYFIDYSTLCKGPRAFAEFLKDLNNPFDEISAEHGIRSWKFLYEAVRETCHLRLRAQWGFTGQMGTGDCVWSQGMRMGELDQCPIFEFDKTKIESEAFFESALQMLCAPVSDPSSDGLRKRNKTESESQYDVIYSYSEGLARVKFNGAVGFIDEAGKIVIPMEYENAGDFEDGLALVRLNGNIGFIDKTGQVVVPLIYQSASFHFQDGLAMVKTVKSGWGFINPSGKVIVPLKYACVEPYAGGLSKVKVGLHFGIIDKQGREIVPAKFSEVLGDFKDQEVVIAKCAGKWWIVDRSGKETGPLEYQEASRFSKGICAVKRGRRWGFIDMNGTVVVDFKYDSEPWAVENGFAVMVGGDKVLIDKMGVESASRTSPPRLKKP